MFMNNRLATAGYIAGRAAGFNASLRRDPGHVGA